MRSLIILVIFILALASCKCEDVSCPGFEPTLRRYLPADSVTILKYVNDSGDAIVFTNDSAGQTFAGIREPIRSIETCDDERCEEYAFFHAHSNTIKDGLTVMRIDISAPVYKSVSINPSKASVSIELFAFRGDFIFYPVLQTNEFGTSYHDSLQLGNRMYQQVVTLSLDTVFIKTRADSLHPIISQIYLTPQQGIIGFDDWKARTTYYLE